MRNEEVALMTSRRGSGEVRAMGRGVNTFLL